MFVHASQGRRRYYAIKLSTTRRAKRRAEMEEGRGSNLGVSVREGEGTGITGGTGDSNGVIGMVFLRNEDHEGGVKVGRRGVTRNNVLTKGEEGIKDRR